MTYFVNLIHGLNFYQLINNESGEDNKHKEIKDGDFESHIIRQNTKKSS